MPNELAKKIVAILEPYVGKMVAKVGLSTQCTVLGKSLDTITKDDLPELAMRIGGVMNTFGKNGERITREINLI